MSPSQARNDRAPSAPWRELVLAIGLSLVATIVSAWLDLHERLHALSRHWESLQLDELPMLLFVLACSLLLLYARRYRQGQRDLRARHAAEQALAEALALNRRLAQRHLLAQEDERKHLARELHDELGQYLNAIKLDAVRLRDSGDAEVRAGAARIVACADHVHAAATGMIRRLRPVGLDELGLAAALEHCVDEWRRRLPGVELGLAIEGRIDGLGETLDLAIYRLVQEALTNASRHARASRIEVRLCRSPGAAGTSGELHVSVSDDGVGLAEPLPAGFGLTGMRERVTLLGGELALEGRRGEGLRLVARLPLEASS